MHAESAFVGVTDVALFEISEIERTKRTSLPSMTIIGGAIKQLPLVVLKGLAHVCANFAAAHFERRALRLAGYTAAFKGLKVRLADEQTNALVDPNDKIVVSLDATLRSSLKTRASVLDMIKTLEDLNPESQVARSGRVLLRAMTDFYEAIDDFKWALMEGDADVEINTGDLPSFSSAADLMAHLRA